eukprot:7381650-Prymnesium_polylepis.1
MQSEDCRAMTQERDPSPTPKKVARATNNADPSHSTSGAPAMCHSIQEAAFEPHSADARSQRSPGPLSPTSPPRPLPQPSWRGSRTTAEAFLWHAVGHRPNVGERTMPWWHGLQLMATRPGGLCARSTPGAPNGEPGSSSRRCACGRWARQRFAAQSGQSPRRGDSWRLPIRARRAAYAREPSNRALLVTLGRKRQRKVKGAARRHGNARGV